MTNLDSVLKSRDITLPTKVHLVKAMVFPVVMYGCESWTIKKAEHWRTDPFEFSCWRRLLRAPWTARRANHSILKEISPGCSLEGLMLKLKLQYFAHLMRRTDTFGKDPDAGKDWRQEETGTIEDEMVEWHHWLNGHEFEQAPGFGDGQGGLTCCSPWVGKESDITARLHWYIYEHRYGCIGASPVAQKYRLHRRCGFNYWVRKISWRRAWQPSPVFLPGECYGQRNLVGYSPQGLKELGMTEAA